jgi:cyclopropane fatty-acyl-phospholipid synthase-like methyltransferase
MDGMQGDTSANNLKKLRTFYESAYATYGDDARSVHWSDAETQEVRFEVLNNIAPLNGMRVLDVGCGLGDLYKFFLKKQIEVDYIGIDIVPAFVTRARERFPDAHFECMDIADVREEYDYVLASGTLNVAIPDAKAHYFATIKTLFDRAQKGIAFNLLNSAGHITNDTYIAYDVGEVTTYCKTLSDNVVVIADYLPWDFTVYVGR